MAARKRLKKDDVLYKEGDTAEFAYLVVSGQLKLLTKKDGADIVLSHVQPGELVGEMSVIDNTPRFSTAIVLEPCIVFKVNRDQLLGRITDSDPIVQSLLTGFSRRYKGSLKLIRGEQEIIPVDLSDTTIHEDLSSKKIALEHELKQAITNKELDVRFQPIIEVASNEIVGYEALIHWEHPERGAISPIEFIALAEETSLIDDLSLFVIQYSCMAIRKFKIKNTPIDPFISINISPKQISHAGFIENTVKTINAYDLPVGSIKLEITENSSLELDKVKHFIELCHEHGIKVALDNFGTGAGNLALMQKFPFDTLNIDRSFTKDMQKNPRSMALVNTIVNLGYTLNADVLVAGIENEEMLDHVRELNCRYAQGYHIGKPMFLEDVNIRANIKLILSDRYAKSRKTG